MDKNVLTKYYTDLFIKENYKFTVITGLIIILLYIAFGTSLILIFLVDWWWKLSVISIGSWFLIKQIIKHKVDIWADKLSRKN